MNIIANFMFSYIVNTAAASRPALGPTQTPIQRAPGIKRLGCEADHSPPSSAEVKNGGAILPFPYMP
jgi:hypothetical protein